MNLSRKQVWQLAIASIIVIGTFVTLYATQALRESYIYAGWIFVVLLLVILSNRLLTYLLDKKYPWLDYGNRRFSTQLTLGVLSSLVIINISYFLLKLFLTDDPPTPNQIMSANVFGILILLPIISINFSTQFLKNWKNAQLNSEKFQKESVKAELTALKNHLDPHFLFNNLNILSSLISKDQKLSQTYLEKFAEVYRSILSSSSEELISLKKELDFVNSYMYLLKIRFEETIQLTLEIPESSMTMHVPPLTLQMLIENAIKHNVVTEVRALKINISIRDNYLIVQNNYQPKKEVPGRSNKSGLVNIMKRYSYFTESEVQVFSNEKTFIVKVPLINISSL